MLAIGPSVWQCHAKCPRCPQEILAGFLGRGLSPEFDDLTRRSALLVIAAAAVLAGAGALYAHGNAAPGCDSEAAQSRLYKILSAQFHLDSIFINNVTTTAGTWFSDRQTCSAEVVSIRGNVNASDMPWRSIRYSIERPAPPQPFKLSVQLGGSAPLAEPAPSLWSRLFPKSRETSRTAQP
jgi:hypothetical protein